MKVILLKEIKGLGRTGDVKAVRDGYGQNFLIARGLARAATAPVLRETELIKGQRREHDAREEERFRHMADALQKTPLTFTMKVSEKGHTFGSVTASDIQTALARKGFVLDRHWLKLPEPLKTTGEHTIAIEFPKHVTASIIVTVHTLTE